MAVRLPRFVVRQDVALCLLIQNIPIVRCTVNRFNPIARSID
ncbi:hypothetical protein QU831_07730 [Escherichia coli]|nr:hypothetical protein [Escherichia coli]WKB05354.1 hypothetical protein QU831_07730 [Escherichia coli]